MSYIDLVRRLGIHGLTHELEQQLEHFHLDAIPRSLLPVHRMDGTVRTPHGEIRSTLRYTKLIDRGGSGLIQTCLRTCPGRSTHERVVVKRPVDSSIDLTAEALLQTFCHSVVEKAGLKGAIPAVYDVYREQGSDEVHFTMEFVEGCGLDPWLRRKAVEVSQEEFTTLFDETILQLACSLHVLEEQIGFDHRDLRPDNLWVRPVPGTYVLSLGTGSTLTLPFQAQIVVLDFGFACLGAPEGHSAISLGGVIPKLDPCPKAGRDMFYCLNNLLAIPGVSDALRPSYRAQLLKWMAPYTQEPPSHSFIRTYDPTFHVHALRPSEFLKRFLLRH